MTTLDFTTLGIIGFLLIGYALLRDWRDTSTAARRFVR